MENSLLLRAWIIHTEWVVFFGCILIDTVYIASNDLKISHSHKLQHTSLLQIQHYTIQIIQHNTHKLGLVTRRWLVANTRGMET